MRYTLRQLEVFLATAQFENISKAAQSLNMSQSAASSALKELESQYTVQLFDRVGKRLQLNEIGKRLRPKAFALLEQAQVFERDIDQHAALGTLNIGATLTIGNYLAVKLLAEYMQRYPESSLNLDVANSAAIARKVLNFELDVGLIEAEYQHPEVDITPWCKDELVVICSPQHPLSEHRRLDDNDLINHGWIVREKGSGTRQAFNTAMRGIMPKLPIIMELQHTEAIKHAVQENLGLACLSRLAVQDIIADGSVKALHVPHRDFTRNFYLLKHKEKYVTTGIQQWLDFCLNTIH